MSESDQLGGGFCERITQFKWVGKKMSFRLTYMADNYVTK